MQDMISLKSYHKSIKLTNQVLEDLNTHEDILIRHFAESIIIQLNNEELFPSWFIKLYLQKELDATLDAHYSEFKLLKQQQNDLIIEQTRKIAAYKREIHEQTTLLQTLKAKQEKLSASLKKIQQAKPTILKSILSLGIYLYFVSQKRLLRIETKLEKINDNLLIAKNQLNTLQGHISDSQQAINSYNATITEQLQFFNAYKEERLNEYSWKLSQVQPLSIYIDKDDSFIPLRTISGYDYQVIIGVYIIHNIEKHKYYVGQSKDIMKRIKQHFNGTVPKNPIFAEDYYTSTMENKEHLFEIKIIPCKTKDELDRLEKSLIAEYDSWNNGYNNTSGNK